MQTHPVYTLAKRIFDEHLILVEINHIELAAIAGEQEVVFESSVYTGMMDFNGVHVERTTHAEEIIRNRLLGRPMSQKDDVLDNTQMYSRFQRRLTINEIVELWDTMQKIHFVDPKDILTVYNTAGDYLDAMGRAYFDLLNYRQPPDGDLAKLRNLREGLKDVANMVDKSGTKGADDWSRFLDAVGGVSTLHYTEAPVYVVEAPKRDRERPRALDLPEEKGDLDIASPFDFLRR